MNEPLRILSLEANNILRLRAVHISPEGDVVVIGGENGQGKSSVLNAIRMAFGGAKAIPPDPVHRGAKDGDVRVDLGEIVVEFVVKKNGKHEVVVKGKDGEAKKKPQELLDKMYSKIAFDPELFSRLDGEKQVKMLMQLLGLDFSQLNAERKALYDKRTSVGSVRSDAEVRVSQFPAACVTAPDEEINVADLVATKDAAEAENRKRLQADRDAAGAVAAVQRIRKELEDAIELSKEANARMSSMPDTIDVQPIIDKIGSADAVNRLVRAKKDRAKANADFKAANAKYEILTEAIAAIDASKTKQLEEAPWPVPGLRFDEAIGVTLHGLPFSQASAAERRLTSFSVGAAMNPQIGVVLIEDGEKLDKSSMRQLAQLAAEKNMQVWLERVGDGDEGAVIIEDGEVSDHSGDV
jgi:DNA repair exonuclease SbcCD ATPase subunit